MASENANREKTIKVEYLTRVEGEGGVYVRSEGGELREVKLNIFEPPRFFEAFLRGRYFQEVPDIVARIWHLPGGLPDERGARARIRPGSYSSARDSCLAPPALLW